MDINLAAVAIAAFVITLLVLYINFFCSRYGFVILLGLAIRLFFIFVHERTRIFTEQDLEDFLPYYIQFSQVADGDWSSFFGIHVRFYTMLYAGWLYSYLGDSSLWLERLINSTLAVASLAPLASLHQSVFGRKLAQWQAYLIVLWPSWIVHSVAVGRTASSVFCILVALSGIFAFLNARNIAGRFKPLPITIVAIFFTCMLRIHDISYFIPALSLGLVNQVKRFKASAYVRWFFYAIAGCIAVPVALTMLNLYQQLLGSRFTQFSDNSLEENVVSLARGGEIGGSAYLQGVYPNTLFDWIWYAPLQAFYYLFSPMPWDIHSPFVGASSVQAWFLLTLCVLAFTKARKLLKENALLKLLLITIIFVALAFGSGVKNAGSAERWRMPLTLTTLTMTTSLVKSRKVQTKPRYQFEV